MKKIFVSIILFVCIATLGYAEDISVGFLFFGDLMDQGFNEMAYTGLAKAQKEYGIRPVLEESGSSEAEREAALQRIIAKNVDVIVVNDGWGFFDLVNIYAANYPQQRFIVNDVPLGGFANVVSTAYGQHEGSFLVGALAAWMSKSKKVGFIGAVDIPVIHAFRVGYLEGIRYVDSTIQVKQTFVSRGDDYSGFVNPAEGYRLANEFYQDGIDVIFAVASETGDGIIQAAREHKKFVVGVDSDQDHLAKGYVLTSMMKRLDITTFKEIVKVIQGQFQPGIQTYGLKEGGVSLTPMTYTRHLVADDILQQLQALEAKIIAGDIQVTDCNQDPMPEECAE